LLSLLSISLHVSSGTVTGNENASNDPNLLPEVEDEEELREQQPTSNGGVKNPLDNYKDDEDDDALGEEDDAYQLEPEEEAANEKSRRDEKRRRESDKKRRISLRAPSVTDPRMSRFSSVFQQGDINAVTNTIDEQMSAAENLGRDEALMLNIFSFMGERDLMLVGTTVNTQWSDWATDTHVALLLESIPLKDDDDEEDTAEDESAIVATREPMLERSWKLVHEGFPWACFLGEGGAKSVYRVHNAAANGEEAISVMYVQFSVYPDIEILHST